MRPLILFAALLFFSPGAAAQERDTSATEEAVTASIQRLFDGMRAGDSTAVRAVFHPEARLLSVADPDSSGVFAVRQGNVDNFVEAVGRPHDAVWDERIGDVDVRIDGGLATAWMPYAFYLGDQFSHCGVNAFHLAQTSEGWKILHITDTRRTTNCDVP